jgi:hypothetical protein
MESNLFFKRKGDTDFHPLEIDPKKHSLFASDRPCGLHIHDFVNGVTPLYTKEDVEGRIHHLRKSEFTCEFSIIDNERLVELFTADINRQLEAFWEKVNLMSELIIQRSDNPIRGTITRRKLRKWHYKGQCFVQDMDGQMAFVGIRRGDDVILCDGRIVKFVDYKRMLTYGKIRHPFAKQ